MFSIRQSLCGLILILLVSCFSVLKAQQSYKGDILLKPLNGKQGEPQLMIFVGHYGIESNAYVDFLERIQQQSEFPLWVANIKYIKGSLSGRGFDKKIERIRRYVSSIEQYDIPKLKTWITGHSKGASLVKRVAEQYAGLILFSSYYKRLTGPNSRDLNSFKKPLLVVSGELDGITRPSYIARDYESKYLSNETDYFSKLVLLVEGVNHSLLAYDDFIMDGDLPATIDSERGRDEVAKAASAFMTYHDINSTKIKAEKTLDLLQEYDDSSAPILNSFFELNQIDNSVCEIVQDEILANGLGSSNPYEIRVTEIDKSTSFALLEPRVSMTHNGNAFVQVYQYNVMPKNPRDVSSGSPAAKRILCKMKTAKAVADSHWTDARYVNNSCSLMQQKFVDMALSRLNEKQLNRYQESGNRINLGREKKYNSSFLWLSNRDPLVIGSNGRYEIRNQTLHKDMEEFVGEGGFQYCKFISPARLLDWYLTDGLFQSDN